jgi:DNA polymerase III alpha subunit
MVVDEYGMVGFTQLEIVDHLRVNPTFNFENCYLLDNEQYEIGLKETYISLPEVLSWKIWEQQKSQISSQEFHTIFQSDWLMPLEYKTLDIASHLISLCKTSEEIDRVNTEIKLYEKFNLLNLLRYLKYLRNTADTHNIVFGVGRGSSCASYCLYLLRIHRVNSIFYKLDINEFLR